METPVGTNDITIDSKTDRETARALESMAFLSRSAMHFVTRSENESPFHFIADQIANLVPEAIVLISDYNPTAKQTVLRAISGPAGILARISGALGRDPMGISFEITEKYQPKVAAGALMHVTGGLHELTFEQLPLDVSRKIEKDFGIEAVYAIPFCLKTDILGSVAILTLRSRELPNVDVIQAFVHQAAVALQKRRAEESLRQAEEKYRNIVETTQEGIWIVDSERRISYVNQRMAEMLGYQPAEMIGLSLLALIGDSEKTFIKNRFPDRRKRGIRERRFLRRDGSPLWCLESTCPYAESAGKTGILGMVTDISARKKSEQDLHEAKERYRIVSELTSDVVFRLVMEDGKPAWDWSTRSPWELLGYGQDELRSADDLRRVVIPEDLPRMHEFANTLMSGRDGVVEARVLTKDGRTTWWRVVGRPARDADGTKVIGWIGAGKDITVAKMSEESLQKANEEMERRVEMRTGELLRSNKLLKEEILERIKAEEALSQRHKAMEAVYSISTKYGGSLESMYDQVVLNIASLLGTPYAVICRLDKEKPKEISQYFGGSLFHEGGISVKCGPCSIIFQHKKVCQFRGQLRKQFPRSHCFEKYDFQSYVGAPVMGREGEVLGILFTVDHKERTFSEYEVHLMEIFARYVAHEIERDIMENRLRHSHEMNVVGQLASGVAHEVRNPLNAILAITEALFQEVGESPEYQPYAEHMREQVNRLSILMQDLLDLGRPIAKSNMRPQILVQICEEAVRQWKRSGASGATGVKVVHDTGVEGIRIHAESTKIQQVLINLLENASQHSAGDGEIQIRVSSLDKETAWVRVQDRGKGIKAEHMDKVFDPFYTTRKGGCGLGLSIVKRLVENHGGSVSIRNNIDGPGCCIELFLPIYEPGIPEISAPAASI